MIIVTDSPDQNRFISEKEKKLISDSAGYSSINTDIKVGALFV
jgi:hypothetical protein